LAGNSEKGTKGMAEEMGRIGQTLFKKRYRKGIEVLGPSTAPFAKMRGKFRWQMLVKGESPQLLHQFAREIMSGMEFLIKGKGVSLDIDVDPVFIL
jgi:primosomal protein N' (replication factor Y)